MNLYNLTQNIVNIGFTHYVQLFIKKESNQKRKKKQKKIEEKSN